MEGGGEMRVEIDTSAPFESVKEAASRFGGIGFWKPTASSHLLQQRLSPSQNDGEEVGISLLEEQASLLEKDLAVKERETLDVLKELEATKKLVDDLKSKLLEHASQTDLNLEPLAFAVAHNSSSASGDEGKGRQESVVVHEYLQGVPNLCPSSAPASILTELKQAKLNLSRTTNDLAGIRASVEFLSKKLDNERVSLDKTRDRLTLNSSKIASLEQELSLTKLKLCHAKAGCNGLSENPLDVTMELERLSCEAEKFKKMGEVAKCEVLRSISDIEQTKTRIKTAEIGLAAARKMKQAARAAESVALSEIKALSAHERASGESFQNASAGVTLTHEEYLSLTCKAQKAEELYGAKVTSAVGLVDEANVSKADILKRVEEATEEVKTSKKALEEALNRVEAANRGKLAVEESLRKWRSENGQRRRSIHNSAKFKNSYPSQYRRDQYVRDVNGLDLVNHEPTPVLKPTLSIGQILSRKLLLPEEYETGLLAEKGAGKRNVSLGQMLRKRNSDTPGNQKPDKENCRKQFSGKRKKFAFARFSQLLVKQNKKKKKPAPDLR